MIDTRLNHAIDLIYILLHNAPFTWAITGSLGLALQGVPVEVHDIDLETNREDIEKLEGRLAAYIVEPAGWKESGYIRSAFGVLQIAGVQVEIMGGCEFPQPDGGWSAPEPLEAHIRWAEYRDMRLPVLDLEHEYRTYSLMGRTAKADLLRAWLDGQRGNS